MANPLEQLDPKALPDAHEERARVAQGLEAKAREAFSRGELLVATLHVSDALMLFPHEPRLLALFDEIVSSTEDPLSLLPVATGAIHVATAAARARVLVMRDRLPQALELMRAVLHVAPDLAYFEWVRRWLEAPGAVPSLSWEELFANVVRPGIELVIDVPAPPDAGDPRLPNVQAVAACLAALRAHHPGEAVIYAGEAMARRRLGDRNAAVAVAEEGAGRFPSDWGLRTTLANALGDAGRVDEALQHARHAMQMREDLSPLHDAAQAFARAGRHAEAAQLFEELVGRDPNYPGARPSLHYARAIAHQSQEDRQALLMLRERRWWDRNVTRLANEVDPPQPHFTTLPGPGDATANAARKLLGEIERIVRCCGRGGHLSLGLRSIFPESPSVGVAFDTALRGMGASGSIAVEHERLPTPDPRAPKAQTPFQVWAYDGGTPRRVYEHVDGNVQAAVANVAAQLFRREIWDPAAQALAAQIGQQLGPNAVHALLAAVLQPPPPPDDFDGIMWTYRYQIAVAVTLSHLGPYPQEPARGALVSLLYGPSDWVTGAAIVALAWRATTDRAARAEVEAIFQWLRGQIPAEGFTPWEIVLADCWLGLGDHPEPLARDLQAWIDRYFATLPKKNVVRRPERRYAGLSLQDYAQFCLERDRIIGTIGYGGPRAAIGAFVDGNVPPELGSLCERYGIPLHHPETGTIYPFVTEWQEALNENPDLHRDFIEIQRSIELEQKGITGEEKAALDNILDGNMDMHLRMAQAQMAQREVQEGGGDPDPVVFPGQPVARLSDYVGILKGMQGGDMMGALGRYGLDMMSYASVAQAWGAKMAADPVLTEKFTRMMTA